MSYESGPCSQLSQQIWGLSGQRAQQGSSDPKALSPGGRGLQAHIRARRDSCRPGRAGSGGGGCGVLAGGPHRGTGAESRVLGYRAVWGPRC